MTLTTNNRGKCAFTWENITVAGEDYKPMSLDRRLFDSVAFGPCDVMVTDRCDVE